MRKKKSIAILILMCFMFTLVPMVVMAASTVTVSTENELLNAISGAEDGAVIYVDGTITIAQSIVVQNKSITIAGTNDSAKIILAPDAILMDVHCYWNNDAYNEKKENGSDWYYDEFSESMFFIGTETHNGNQIDNNAFENPKITAELTLKNITIDANEVSRVGYVGKLGKLILDEDSILQNGKTADHGGAVLNVGTMEIHDGTITGCAAENNSKRGGAVYCYGGKLTMTDGLITQNKCAEGTLFVDNGGEIRLTGGSITNNKSTSSQSAGIHIRKGSYVYLSEDVNVYNNINRDEKCTDIWFETLSDKVDPPAINIEGELTTEHPMHVGATINSISDQKKVNRFSGYDGYKLTVSDLSKFVVFDSYFESCALQLDKAQNVIYTGSPVSIITFNSNYGDGETKKQGVVKNEEAALLPNSFSREGYIFTGWNTNAGGSGIAYNDGAFETWVAHTTLHAQWELKAPTDVKITADDTNIVTGADVTMTASAKHDLDEVLQYQWYKGNEEIGGATSDIYTATGLTANTTFTCKVKAVNGSDESEEVTEFVTIKVAAAEGNIAIAEDTMNATYGDAAKTFTYETNIDPAKLSVESSRTDVATVSNDIATKTVTVTIVGVGTTDITVAFVGDENYSSASDKFTLTVSPEPAEPILPSTSNSGGGFTGSYNYPVNVPEVNDCDVTLSESNATEGETVVATVTPDNGYGVADVIVTDEDGNVIPVTMLGSGEYSFVMPEGEVDVQVICKPVIVLTIDSVYINVYGKIVENDVAPMITPEGRTMLPIRVIAEALGADVDWNPELQKVTITKDSTVIELFIGKYFAYVNGEIVKLDTAAFIENDRTYLQVRFVSEMLNCIVNWDAVTRTVTIIPE